MEFFLKRIQSLYLFCENSANLALQFVTTLLMRSQCIRIKSQIASGAVHQFHVDNVYAQFFISFFFFNIFTRFFLILFMFWTFSHTIFYNDNEQLLRWSTKFYNIFFFNFFFIILISIFSLSSLLISIVIGNFEFSTKKKVIRMSLTLLVIKKWWQMAKERTERKI